MIKLSNLILEQSNKPKAIVMAGGAGAGKSYLLNQLGLEGLKLYNPDKYVEDKDHPFFNNLSAASGQVAKDVEVASDSNESFIWDTTAGKTVYSLIETYKSMLGENFTIFVNKRGGEFDKEIDEFNIAASKGAKGIENYLNQYMENQGGKDAFKSTFSKPFKLDDEADKAFRELAANTSADLDNEATYKTLAKDYKKYQHHYDSGKYGADRIQSNYNKYLATLEKNRQRSLGDLETIADLLFNPSFIESLNHSEIKEIDQKIQRFLT